MRHIIKDQAGNMVTELALMITLLTLMFFLGAFVINHVTKDTRIAQDLERLTAAENYYDIIQIGINEGGH